MRTQLDPNNVDVEKPRGGLTITLKDGLLVKPSSAASEWVFSLLQNSFTPQQSGSLEDNNCCSFLRIIRMY